MKFQQLLFGDEPEAQAQEAARLAALDYAKWRKLAWNQGDPFPEDQAKWYAAHRDLTNARCRETYRENYAAVAEYYLRSAALYRAEQLGCKIGRRGPILKIYARAVHAPVLLCYWCKTLTRAGERHVDHIYPLAAGGPHVAGNLCITCADCNLTKNDTGPTEFRQAVVEKRIANSLIAADYFKWALKAALPSV